MQGMEKCISRYLPHLYGSLYRIRQEPGQYLPSRVTVTGMMRVFFFSFRMLLFILFRVQSTLPYFYLGRRL